MSGFHRMQVRVQVGRRAAAGGRRRADCFRAGFGMLCAAAACQALAAASAPPDPGRSPAASDLFFGRSIRLSPSKRTLSFPAADKRAGFTYFDNVRDLRTDGGSVRFSLETKPVLLGWGNAFSRLSATHVPSLDPGGYVARVHLPACSQAADWTLRFWRDGSALDGLSRAKSAASSEPQILEFPFLACSGAALDGMEFSVTAPPGTHIAIAEIELRKTVHEGWCRFEFDLPDVRIWRAVADVGSANDRCWFGRDPMRSELYINGQLVPRPRALYLYHTAPVDIAPYLRPGRNCVAFYGFRMNAPAFLYFQARIVLEDGRIVRVATGPDWKVSYRFEQGWNRPGFRDDSWQAARCGPPPDPHIRDSAGRLGLPAYSGRILIERPGSTSLFYTDDQPVTLDVLIPAGLGRVTPRIEWAVGRANASGRVQPFRNGAVAEFARRDRSLRFRIPLGGLAAGVYAVAVRLVRGDGNIVEERPPEPFVVVPRLRPPVIGGVDWFEGVDTEIEDRLDFTDPSDPHPWIEAAAPARPGQPAQPVSTPRIVRKNGLVYREVSDPRRGSGFSYRIEFRHPGDFYLLELEYPDDARRVIEVVLNTKIPGVWTNSQSGVGAETGGVFLNSGRMQTLRWLHVADAGPHSVEVLNVLDGAPAAARGLRILHVRGQLPALKIENTRRYGIHTERCFFTSGVGMNFGTGRPLPAGVIRKEDRNRPLLETVFKDLVWMLETSTRYVQYLKFTGQNLHVMGCFQYSDANTPFVPKRLDDDPGVVPCLKTMLAHVLDANDIDFYASVEWSQPQNARTFANNAQVACGADTVWMVDARGRQRYGLQSPTVVPNWLHPAVQREFRQLLSDLACTFGALPHFRGIHSMLGPVIGAGYWPPAWGEKDKYDQPLITSFDDVTVRMFCEETGVRLPVSDTAPNRFVLRAAWLRREPLRSKFLAWRCEALRRFLNDAVTTLRKVRPDLEAVGEIAVEDRSFFQYLVDSGRSFPEILKDFGIDVRLLAAVPGLRLGRWTVSWRQTVPPLPSQDALVRLARWAPDIVGAFPPDAGRTVFVRTSWDENMFVTGGCRMRDRHDVHRPIRGDWVLNAERIRALP